MKKWSIDVIFASLLILLVLLLIRYTALYSPYDFSHYNEATSLSLTENIRWSSEPFDINLINEEYQHLLQIYTKALVYSVAIIKLDNALSKDLIQQCRILKERGLLSTHQHSSELHFPHILKAMSSKYSSLKLLHTNGTYKNQASVTNSNSMRALPPLFYYIEAYPYHAIYCTPKKNRKEDWTKRDTYWLSVADYLYEYVPEYRLNLGQDFLTTASHPLSGPYRIHPYRLNYLHRITFLRTDFDISGSFPKDIIVPYYTHDTFPSSSSAYATVTPTQRPHKYLLFFSGTDHPSDGYRSLFIKQYMQYTASIPRPTSDIHISTQPMPSDEYTNSMQNSLFCLCLRGDTTSSQRLFTAIAAGCIPVIIADWIDLPFQGIINYDMFTVRLPESVAFNIAQMVRILRDMPAEKISAMQGYLRAVRPWLLYPSSTLSAGDSIRNLGHNAKNVIATYSTLNPVSLTFIDALIRREAYCNKSEPIRVSSGMCQKLYERLRVARAMVDEGKH